MICLLLKIIFLTIQLSYELMPFHCVLSYANLATGFEIAYITLDRVFRRFRIDRRLLLLIQKLLPPGCISAKGWGRFFFGSILMEWTVSWSLVFFNLKLKPLLSLIKILKVSLLSAAWWTPSTGPAGGLSSLYQTFQNYSDKYRIIWLHVWPLLLF